MYFFNVFEAIRHHKESPLCHQVEVVEEVVKEVYQSESSVLHIERFIMNSINKIKELKNSEVEECLFRLKASQVERYKERLKN